MIGGRLRINRPGPWLEFLDSRFRGNDIEWFFGCVVEV